MLRWIGRNLGTLILAFVLAVVVWVSAVVAADPNQEGVYPSAVDLEIIAQDPALLLTNRVHPSRNNLAIRGFRPRIHDAVMRTFFRR